MPKPKSVKPTIKNTNKSTGENITNQVVVLGAGAAGLMCAITAGRRGRQVLVLEKSNKVGKKILMSGGGRCNFTNYHIGPENYISNNPHFCKSAFSGYSQWDFIALVEKHGIAYEERKHAQLFCKSSAKEILAMLLKECELVGVEIKTDCDLDSISTLPQENVAIQGGNKFTTVYLQNGKKHNVKCESIVIATGALSIPTLGGSGIGYELASQFGLALTERRAGLVPFMFSDNTKLLCERLSGLALEVEVSCKRQRFTENMLFTHRGISGPAILQISNYWHLGETITINLLPRIDAGEWLILQKHQAEKKNLTSILSKCLSKALVQELQRLWWPELAGTAIAEISDKALVVIGEKLNNWWLKPSATEGYRTAEVTLGGVNTNNLSSKTMEAKLQPGLYFIGEVVDVTGHLGGFNFQWAWSSGYAAGLYV